MLGTIQNQLTYTYKHFAKKSFKKNTIENWVLLKTHNLCLTFERKINLQSTPKKLTTCYKKKPQIIIDYNKIKETAARQNNICIKNDKSLTVCFI